MTGKSADQTCWELLYTLSLATGTFPFGFYFQKYPWKVHCSPLSPSVSPTTFGYFNCFVISYTTWDTIAREPWVELTLTKLYDLRAQSCNEEGLYLCQIPLQLHCDEDSYAAYLCLLLWSFKAICYFYKLYFDSASLYCCKFHIFLGYTKGC